MTVRNAVKIYGLENLPEKAVKSYNTGSLEDKITIVHVIEPRLDRDKKKQGVKDMQNICFISYPCYGGFYFDHLTLRRSTVIKKKRRYLSSL